MNAEAWPALEGAAHYAEDLEAKAEHQRGPFRCTRCGGRLFLEPEGDALGCTMCGERLWSRQGIIVDRLLEAVLILQARDDGGTRRYLHYTPGTKRPNRRKKVAAA